MENILLSVSAPIVSVIAVALFVVGLAGGFLVFKIYSSKKLEKNKSTIKKEAIIESKEQSQKLKEEVE